MYDVHRYDISMDISTKEIVSYYVNSSSAGHRFTRLKYHHCNEPQIYKQRTENKNK